MTELEPKPPLSVDSMLQRASSWISAGKEVAEVLVQAGRKPGPLSVVGVGLAVLDAVREARTMDADSYFRAQALVKLPVWGLAAFLHRSLKGVGSQERPSNVEGLAVRIVTLGAFTYAFDLGENGYAWGPYIPRDQDAEKSRSHLARAIWEKFECRPLRLASMPSPHGSGRETTLEVDRDEELLDSGRARALANRMGSRLGAVPSASVLLAGTPGSGKSSEMRWVASKIGGLQLRIPAEMVYLDKTWISIIRLLRPSTLLVDDIDRVGRGLASCLTELEELKSIVKLFMASANSRSAMTQAALRPGRFDEIHIIDTIDDEVLTKLLGEDNDDAPLRARLAALPVAYVAEYVTRRKFLPKAEAIAELEELEARSKAIAAEIAAADEEEDDEEPDHDDD